MSTRLTRYAVSRLYQPIADYAAQRHAMTCFRLGQHCAVAACVSADLYLMLDTEHTLTLRIFSFVGFTLLCAWYYAKGEKLEQAFMRMRPQLFEGYGDALLIVWLVVLATDIAALWAHHTLGDIFNLLVDPTFISINMFYMCKPLWPSDKRSESAWADSAQ